MKRYLMLLLVALSSWALAAGSSTEVVESTDLEQAQMLIDNEDYQGAVNFLKLLLARDEANADYHNLMGYSLRQLDDLEASMTHYFRALELDPNHLGANEYLGELFLRMNDLANAEMQLDTLVSLGCEVGCEEYDMLASAIEKFQETGSADW